MQYGDKIKLILNAFCGECQNVVSKGPMRRRAYLSSRQCTQSTYIGPSDAAVNLPFNCHSVESYYFILFKSRVNLLRILPPSSPPNAVRNQQIIRRISFICQSSAPQLMFIVHAFNLGKSKRTGVKTTGPRKNKLIIIYVAPAPISTLSYWRRHCNAIKFACANHPINKEAFVWNILRGTARNEDNALKCRK